MTSIISTLSGKFGKSLIMGTMLPVTIFVILVWKLLQPVTGEIDLSKVNLVGLPESQSNLLNLSLVIVLLSALLYYLNIPIIRIYEGYPWKNTWIGRWRIDRYQKEYYQVTSRAKGYRTLLVAIQSCNHSILTQWTEYMQNLRKHYLMDPNEVLPTKLGNTIRSFEKYSHREYGIDSVTLWPGLISVVDKGYVSMVDDAKIAFDFMINSSFLLTLLVIALILGGVAFPTSLASAQVLLPWIFELALISIFAWGFYMFSIDRAISWGYLVRSAFDIYRWDLLRDLGFTQLPQNKEQERVLWREISQQIAYGDSPTGPRPSYTWGSPSTSAIGSPHQAKLELSRGLIPMKGQKYKVIIQVKNVDPGNRTVKNITVLDTLPENYVYVWGSAKIKAQIGEISGWNPIQFKIPEMQPQTVISISYRILKI